MRVQHLLFIAGAAGVSLPQQDGKREGSSFLNDGNCYFNLFRALVEGGKKRVEAVGAFSFCGIFRESLYSDLNMPGPEQQWRDALCQSVRRFLYSFSSLCDLR